MKRIAKIAIMIGLIFLLLPGLSFGTGLDLRIYGGLSYFSPQDVNKGVKGWTDLHAEFLTDAGYSQQGDTEPIRWGMDLGGDILVHFTPVVALGIGVGYIKGDKTSEIIFEKGTTVSMTNQIRISAVPIRAGLFFTIPMNHSANLSLHVGSGYYLAKCNWDWNSGSLGELHHSTKANGFGFDGGLGFEFNLSPGLAFFVEGTARYAKIKGFEGTEKGREVSDTWEQEGTLYYVEGTSYPALLLRESMPSGYRIAREAEVDFSSVAVTAGLKLKF
jgi:hypothetical protein